MVGVLSACAGSGSNGQTDDLLVVTTTTILGAITSDVVGDAGTVDVLMEPGQDPHAFALSAQQAARLREADLVIANGLGLEAALHDTLESVESEGVPVLYLGEELDPRPASDGEDEHDHDHDDKHGLDPHVWLDPVRMADAARLIAERLSRLGRGPAEDWAANGERVAGEMMETDAEVASMIGRIPSRCRTLVTNHDSLGYFASRYELDVIGTVIPGLSTDVAPTAEAFAELVELLDETRVPAIFVESTNSSRLAESLSNEVGYEVELVELFTGSLGEPGSGADTYAGMLLTDARRIADALSDC